MVLSVFRVLSDISPPRVQHFLAGYLSTVVEMVWLVRHWFSPEISHTVDLGQGDLHRAGVKVISPPPLALILSVQLCVPACDPVPSGTAGGT